jgi:hypothetical protein
MRQRDKMKQLFVRHGGNEEVIVREYARAESRGEVLRSRNSHNLSAVTYARALLRDGKRKSWLA